MLKLNVVFEDEYTLYRSGMEWLLTELFRSGENVKFSEMDHDSVMQADIIVKSFSAGEHFLCQPLMKVRRQGCLVIGVCEGIPPSSCAELPLCLSNMVFIHRTTPLHEITELIFAGWQRCQLETQSPANKNCLTCQHLTLTLQQASVAMRFYQGEETRNIARKMKISTKTVSSHKYSIMKKFNVETDQDLLTLLHVLKKQVVSPNIFKEFLNHFY